MSKSKQPQCHIIWCFATGTKTTDLLIYESDKPTKLLIYWCDKHYPVKEITDFPGQRVDAYLKEHGRLPE